jgi:hypothetical protein
MLPSNRKDQIKLFTLIFQTIISGIVMYILDLQLEDWRLYALGFFLLDDVRLVLGSYRPGLQE